MHKVSEIRYEIQFVFKDKYNVDFQQRPNT